MITHVAIVFNGVTYSLPKPNRHHHVIRHIADVTGATYVSGKQGFLDDLGKFLDREKALLHAKQCGQVSDTGFDELFSEDVW